MAFIPDEAVDRMAELSAGAWRLYCFLARCRNQKTGKCCPSAQTVAQVMKVDRRHIFRLKGELSQAGWARFKGSNVTELLGFADDKKVITAINENVTDIKVTDDKNVTPLVTKMSLTGDKNVSDIKEEPAKEPAKRTSKENMSGPVSEVFTYWQRVMNHQQAKLTAERRKKIEARLKEKYSVEQIKSAIDGCRSSPYHQGQNDHGTVYDDIELICRNGSKLESFIAKAGNNGTTPEPERPPLVVAPPEYRNRYHKQEAEKCET